MEPWLIARKKPAVAVKKRRKIKFFQKARAVALYLGAAALVLLVKSIDYGRMAEILVQREAFADEFTQLIAINWVVRQTNEELHTIKVVPVEGFDVGEILSIARRHRDKHVEVPIPIPKKGEVLVKVEAVGINPIDYKIQGGMLRPFVPRKFPHIPCSDIVGEIIEIGPGVAKF
ncbi:hypothetical protein AgCh_038758 [Apium graveolens]